MSAQTVTQTVTQTGTPNPRAQSWNAALAAKPDELDLEIPATQITGQIPAALQGGRFLSNGPGWNKIGDTIAHPFDGHGYVRMLSFNADGSCSFKARFVQTPAYLEEKQTGAFTRRGFATNRVGGFWRNLGFRGEPRNVANTTITRWHDRILAGWEGGSPYALDAQTLQTRGEETFGGAIQGETTLAHMRHDRRHPQGPRLVLCGLKNGRETEFTFRELDATQPNGRVLTQTAPVKIAGMLFSHDFAIAPHWYVLGGNPLQLQPAEVLKMVLGGSTLLRSVQPDMSQAGKLYLISRPDTQGTQGTQGTQTPDTQNYTAKIRTITLPDRAFVVHFGNAFETDKETIVDACVFTRFSFGEEFGYTGTKTPFDPTLPDQRGPQKLYRIYIPHDSDTARWQLLTQHGVDFPRFHPDHEGIETPVLFGASRRDTRYSDPFDSIVGVNLLDLNAPTQIWTAPEASTGTTFVGEPVFVPAGHTGAGHTGAGYVIAVVSYGLAGKSHVVVLDAQNLAAGPVATVPLPLLPVAFHGDWDGTGVRG